MKRRLVRLLQTVAFATASAAFAYGWAKAPLVNVPVCTPRHAGARPALVPQWPPFGSGGNLVFTADGSIVVSNDGSRELRVPPRPDAISSRLSLRDVEPTRRPHCIVYND